jgi:hypothetical protein
VPSSATKEQSSLKKRLMTGGTKTPGHQKSTDFNQLSQSRKSAA